MADAYGSGPYGATRGGSTPLVSKFIERLDQFAKFKARVEKQTGWTSEQLEHRVSRYKKLPNTQRTRQLVFASRLLL
jgi:hypothetical protein